MSSCFETPAVVSGPASVMASPRPTRYALRSQAFLPYLSEGGTVSAWFAHNAQRAEEIRNTEEAWRSRFVCHLDGTVDEEAYCSE